MIDRSAATGRETGRNGDFVQSFERGLAVLRSFGPDRPSMTLSEAALQSGLTRAAARRFLLTLERLGYVAFDGRLFSLRPRVLELGYAYLASLPIWELAAPHMRDLVEQLHESSSSSVLDDDEIVYVARVPTKRIMTINLVVGSRLPAYPTSMGRVLLAGLAPQELDGFFDRVELEPLTERTVTDEGRLRSVIDEVREQGWAIVDQELEEGVRSVAAPLVNADGRVVAALNVSGHATRVTLETLRRTFLPRVLDTAGRINTDLRSRR
ncbi:MAG: IclR family transcriptional regulator domain-containing protein [Acidimicrobiales bacterium]